MSTVAKRRRVGLTLTRRVKQQVLEAAAAQHVSAGDWVLRAAAVHAGALQEALDLLEVRSRPRVEDAVFTALELTPEEQAHLDNLAVACGLNRSAFASSVSRLALGEEMQAVLAPLVEPG